MVLDVVLLQNIELRACSSWNQRSPFLSLDLRFSIHGYASFDYQPIDSLGVHIGTQREQERSPRVYRQTRLSDAVSWLSDPRAEHLSTYEPQPCCYRHFLYNDSRDG